MTLKCASAVGGVLAPSDGEIDYVGKIMLALMPCFRIALLHRASL